MSNYSLLRLRYPDNLIHFRCSTPFLYRSFFFTRSGYINKEGLFRYLRYTRTVYLSSVGLRRRATIRIPGIVTSPAGTPKLITTSLRGFARFSRPAEPLDLTRRIRDTDLASTVVYLAWERFYRDWLNRRVRYNDYAPSLPEKFDSDAS